MKVRCNPEILGARRKVDMAGHLPSQMPKVNDVVRAQLRLFIS